MHVIGHRSSRKAAAAGEEVQVWKAGMYSSNRTSRLCQPPRKSFYPVIHTHTNRYGGDDNEPQQTTRFGKAYYPVLNWAGEHVDSYSSRATVGARSRAMDTHTQEDQRTERTCTKSISHEFGPLNAIAQKHKWRKESGEGGTLRVRETCGR